MSDLDATDTDKITAAKRLARRVRFHWFMLGGGQPNGFKDGKATYTQPLDPAEHEHCPYHGPNCEAWAVIKTAEKPEVVTMNGFTLEQLQTRSDADRELARIAAGDRLDQSKGRIDRSGRRTSVIVRATNGDQPVQTTELDDAVAELIERN